MGPQELAPYSWPQRPLRTSLVLMHPWCFPHGGPRPQALQLCREQDGVGRGVKFDSEGSLFSEDIAFVERLEESKLLKELVIFLGQAMSRLSRFLFLRTSGII